jgi:uncharacterized protein
MWDKSTLHWQGFFIRLTLALAAAWAITVLALSLSYVENLLKPDCIRSGTVPDGFHPVELTTADHIPLQGWWRPPENGVAVLLLGGLGASRDSMLPQAQILAANGYGALTLDYRHCAGKISALGYRETAELDAMAAFAQLQPGVEHTVVLGFSVGGAAALMGAAENQHIEAVIAEGNYANLKDEITAGSTTPLSLRWQIQHSILLGYWLRTGTPPALVSPLDAIPFISPRPILFIHGEEEIERTRGKAQFAAAENAELWVVPSARHGAYLQIDPKAYEERVIQFLEDCFSGDQTGSMPVLEEN